MAHLLESDAVQEMLFLPSSQLSNKEKHHFAFIAKDCVGTVQQMFKSAYTVDAHFRPRLIAGMIGDQLLVINVLNVMLSFHWVILRQSKECIK